MPQWTRRPPPEAGPHAFRILRTPALKPLSAVITGPEAIGTATHYVNNRTVPCEGEDDCPHHAAGISWRWHGWVSCIVIATLEHVLFEFTAKASDTFDTYQTIHGNLRSCFFEARRPSGKTNGRVVIRCKPSDLQRFPLPEPPNIARILCHIWNVPYDPAQTWSDRTRLGQQIGTLPQSGNGDGDGRKRPSTSTDK